MFGWSWRGKLGLEKIKYYLLDGWMDEKWPGQMESQRARPNGSQEWL